MRSFIILLACCGASAPARAALLFYDGFEYTAGQPLAPTNDTTATPNPGQLNVAYGVNWRYTGGGGATNAAPSVADNGLVAPGYPTSPGNSALFDTTQIGSARIQVTPAAINSGTVYWSAVLRVNADLTTLNFVNGMLLGGFNNAAGAGTLPTIVGAGLRIRKDASLNQYYVGTGMNSGTGVGNVQFDTATPHFEGETVFVVGAYEFVAGANNDKAYMWINPDPNSFGAGTAPTPTLTSAPGGTIADSFASLLSFNLRNVSTVGSPKLQLDELRVGNEWASVTVPEPTSVVLLLSLVSCLLLSRPGRRTS